MTRRVGLLASIGVWAAVAGCRDTSTPFTAEDELPIDPPPRRLTYSSGDDRSPAWSATSDTIYYSASKTETDRSDGVLMAIRHRGGVARPMFPGQLGRSIPPRLVEPAPSPTTPQLAFLELRPLRSETPCGGDSVACTSSHLASPSLDEVWMHRASDAGASAWLTAGILNFLGGPRETLERIGGFVVFESVYTPAQYRWAAERALPSKPTWSPDGPLATADDEGIRIVEPDGAVRMLVAGHVGNPAWSPDGEWIAFDRVETLDTVMDLCTVLAEDRRNPDVYQALCYERRVFVRTTHPVIAMIRPDGTGEVILGSGSDPEWHPNGESLVYVTDEGIVRRFFGTDIVEPIAGTSGGREPVVSPDGQWIAFTRFDEAVEGHDLWVAALSR